jgi:hypothetical protein
VQSVSTVTLMLVCLDEWKFEMHGGTERTHSSSPNASESIYVGNVQIDEFDRFGDVFQTLLNEAKKRKGDKRSAVGHKQGHQKTPAMIQAVLLDALANLVKKTDDLTPARGGFTDVGLHTGGHARNTAWPLVNAVTQVILESAGFPNL